MKNDHAVRIAILDLYDNWPNQGMRCIQEIITGLDKKVNGQSVTYDVYETRSKAEIPDLEYDIYISSGGPGSPFDGEGKEWEKKYFDWWAAVWKNNHTRPAEERKYVFSICHSFQMMCRFFELGLVTEIGAKSFGIMPVYQTSAGEIDPLYEGLSNPFYAADFRDWQVVQPNEQHLAEVGAEILSWEKNKPDSPHKRSIMAIRVSPEIAGVQYHPEADPISMQFHAEKPERKQDIIERFGIEKYNELMQSLDQPESLLRTRATIMPNFLRDAISNLRPEAAENGRH